MVAGEKRGGEVGEERNQSVLYFASGSEEARVVRFSALSGSGNPFWPLASSDASRSESTE